MRKMEHNPCGKSRPLDAPYEIWKGVGKADGWTWRVLKKWQAPKNEAKNENARWFCGVSSPLTYGSYDLGDVYVSEVKESAVQIWSYLD